jgi:predicted anti-sigma-YlaC factor YlaD
MAPTRQCERCRGWVSLDLDAELSEFEAAVMRRHLRDCAACRTFSHDVRAATALVRAARPVELETPVIATAPRRRSGRLQRLSVGAAVAVASVAAVFASGLQGDQRSSAVTSVALAGSGNRDLAELRALRRAELHMPAQVLNAMRPRVIELD